MDALDSIIKIGQSGGPVLAIFLLWIGYRAMRTAEKAVESFTGMRDDIAKLKEAVLATAPKSAEAAEGVARIEAAIKSVDDHTKDNGAKLDKLVLMRVA